MANAIKKRMSPTLTISLGYFIIITIGTILLMLPFSTRTGTSAGIETALFTATSATCVTGLIIEDTFTFWSIFGQIVILCLIQIGGIGFMTLAITAITFTKKKISLRERNTLKESYNASQIGGIVRMSRFIFLGTAMFEIVGAATLCTRFCPKFGFLKGLYFSIFHSVSAFCNAGFDLMGDTSGKFSSLTSFSDDITVNIVIMMLIIIGGLGFFVWSDLVKTKFRFRHLRLHSKIVLVTTAVLIIVPFLLIMLFEKNSPVFEGKSQTDSIFIALFQAVTPRTAGFNTVDLTQLSNSTLLIMIALMLIGGSPSSTAGGIKTTTVAVMFISIFTVFRRKKDVEIYNRRLQDSTLIHICCLMALYIMLFVSGSTIICALDKITITQSMFEVASAVGTVGLTLGVTPQLSGFSHLILIMLMFFGRVGGLTLLLSIRETRNVGLAVMPIENITIG